MFIGVVSYSTLHLSTVGIISKKTSQLHERTLKILLLFLTTYLCGARSFLYIFIYQNNRLQLFESRNKYEDPVVFY